MANQTGAGGVTYNDLNGKQLSKDAFLLDANIQLQPGQPVGLITGNARDQQTTFSVSGGTPASGNSNWQWMGKIFTIAWNETAATLRTKLNALFGTDNIIVTGGAFPGTALVVQTTKTLGALTQPTPTLLSHDFSAGTPAAAITQTAIPAGKAVAWNGLKIANPATAPSVSATGTGSAFAAGSVNVSYTWITASGETLASPGAGLALTGGQQIRFAAITSGNVPAGATGVNIYVNGVRATTVALSSGAVPQTDISAYAAGTNFPVPSVNTAFVNSDGRAVFAGFSVSQVTTDAIGNVVEGDTNVPSARGARSSRASVFVGGIFQQRDLFGTASDLAEIIRQRGGLILSGTLAAGNATIAVNPLGPEI